MGRGAGVRCAPLVDPERGNIQGSGVRQGTGLSEKGLGSNISSVCSPPCASVSAFTTRVEGASGESPA
jgi:hypothetical protein